LADKLLEFEIETTVSRQKTDHMYILESATRKKSRNFQHNS